MGNFDNLQKITDRLYYLEYNYEYYLDELLAQGAKNIFQVGRFVQMKNSLKNRIKLDGHIGCTTLHVQNPEGDELLGRNLDYKEGPALLVKTAPKNGYKSLSFTLLNGMLYAEKIARVDESNRDRLFAAPYQCTDGINEKGLVVAVLEIEAKPTKQRTGKTPIGTCVMIRTLLDKCANVQEAVEMMKKYDMRASMAADYHFHILDATGACVLVEYINNEMVVYDDKNYAMNFYFNESGDNKRAMGRTRQKTVESYLAKQDKFTVDEIMMILKDCILCYRHQFGHMVNTIYSAVYNASKKSIIVCSNRDYDKQYKFDLD